MPKIVHNSDAHNVIIIYIFWYFDPNLTHMFPAGLVSVVFGSV